MSVLASINKVLLLARFLVVLIPLSGYIHPDEFFQSPEIVASDVFGQNISRTWEWDRSSPARTIIFPALSSGIPFLAIQFLHSFIGLDISTYLLLTLPRIFMALSTYGIDLAIEKLAEKVYGTYEQNGSHKTPMEIASFLFRSSAVTLVFLTKTFSNTFETVLLSMFLWKLMSQINQKDFSNCLNSSTTMLSAITVFGFFIRPTFIFFISFGLITYAVVCLRYKKILSQAVVAIVTSTTMALIIVVLDSLYFSYGNNFKISITPLNFIKYNLEEANLEQHGRHPRYLHFIVNCPLLFGPLIFTFTSASYNLLRKPLNPSSTNSRINRGMAALLIATAWSSVFSLSYFKHQEPRFIVPIIIPMCITSAWFLNSYPKAWKRFVNFWLVFNLSLMAWYGFVHQGGIAPCLSRLDTAIKRLQADRFPCQKYDFVFWYTYMAPRHLITTANNEAAVDIKIHNLGGMVERDMKAHIDGILKNSKGQIFRKCNSQVFLAIPATINISSYKEFRLQLDGTFFPHLSVEAPPWGFIQKSLPKVYSAYLAHWHVGLEETHKFLANLRTLTSLNLYRVS